MADPTDPADVTYDFKFSMDVGLDEWKRDVNSWTLELPYLSFTNSGNWGEPWGEPHGTQMHLAYGDGHVVHLTIVSDRCVSEYTIQIPEDAIWAIGGFSKYFKIIYDMTIKLSLPHITSERYNDWVDMLCVAVDQDDLVKVRHCVDEMQQHVDFLMWRKTNDTRILGLGEELLLYARSGDVALELCALVPPKTVVNCMCMYWKVLPNESLPSGKTRIQRDDGHAAHVWDTLVEKYGVTFANMRSPNGNPLVFDDKWIREKIDKIKARVADEIQRTRDRLDAYKRELIEKTWHPSRLAWCLDTQETDDLFYM